MKTLKESIRGSMGGFFKNVGADLTKAKEWIERVPVLFDLYGMQYDKHAIERNPDNYSIKFLSAYKRRAHERDITLNLSPFVNDLLMKYNPEQCVITFGWGWGGNTPNRYKKELKINHPQSKEMFDEWKPGEFDLKDDKMIKVTIAYFEKPVPKTLRDNIITGSEINRMGKPKPLLIFGVYLNDYPFTEDSWTLLENDL